MLIVEVSLFVDVDGEVGVDGSTSNLLTSFSSAVLVLSIDF